MDLIDYSEQYKQSYLQKILALDDYAKPEPQPKIKDIIYIDVNHFRHVHTESSTIISEALILTNNDADIYFKQKLQHIFCDEQYPIESLEYFYDDDTIEILRENMGDDPTVYATTQLLRDCKRDDPSYKERPDWYRGNLIATADKLERKLENEIGLDLFIYFIYLV